MQTQTERIGGRLTAVWLGRDLRHQKLGYGNSSKIVRTDERIPNQKKSVINTLSDGIACNRAGFSHWLFLREFIILLG